MKDNLALAPRTVLLIEASPAARAAYRSALAHLYHVVEAARLAEGLELKREHQPDCILLAHQLPDSDAVSALPSLLSHACAIVVLTDEENPQLAIEARQAGAHDYLDKNRLRGQTLLQIVNNSIEKVAAQRLIVAQQRQLAESEARFSAVFHHSSAPMSIVSALDAKYVDVNQAYAELFGLSPAELRGRSPAELNIYAVPAQRLSLEEMLHRDGFIRDVEVQWRVQEGDLRTYLLRADHITLNGEPCFFVVGNDITKRKRAEEQLRRNHETFFNLVQNTPFGIYVVDADFRLIQISAGSQKVFSHVQPLIGRDFAEVLRVVWAEPFASEAIAHFRHTLATGETYRAADTSKLRSDIEDEESYDWKLERITLPDGRFGVVCYFYDLTERLQLEEKLRASAERMQLVLNAAKIGIWIYDLGQGNIYWSPEQYEIFGTDQFDGTIEGFKEFIHPDDREMAWTQFTETIANGTVYQPEFRIVRPHGETCWVGNSGHVEYDENGKPLRFLCAVFDITERKFRERNLTFLAAVARDFVPRASATEIMQMTGKRIAEYLNLAHCLFVEINETAEEAIVIHDQHTTAAQSLVGVYRLADFHTEAERRQLAAGQPLVINDVRDDSAADAQFEALGIRALANAPYVSDGRWKFVLSAQHSQPQQWRTDEIELLQELAARIYLRLERAHAEEALHESEQQLRSALANVKREQTQLQVILANLPIGVMVTDVTGKARILNQALSDIWRGERPLDSLAKYNQYQAWDPVTHEFFGPEDWPISKALLTGAPQLGQEVGFQRFDDTIGIMSVVAVPIKDEHEEIIGGVAVAQDITERKAIEAERERLLVQEQQARAAAEAATRAKDEFLSIVSHELRNPLNSILGYARLTLANPHNTAQVVSYCEIIERDARMQQQLIEDLLDTARIVSGKLKIESAPADLRLILADALAVVRPTAEAKQLALVARWGNDPQPIIGDAARLQQVVWNLLQNASKFTPNGGRVELRMERTGQFVRVIVSDTGAGIEAEFLPTVFDPFSQDDSSRTRRHGGLGLGLSLVKQLVELHGGTVAAASAGTGQGSTFTVTLPLRVPQNATAPPRSFAEINLDTKADWQADLPRLDQVRVLLVATQEEMRVMSATLLSELGAVITTVAATDEAEAQLAQTTYDILLYDIAPLEADGYEVLRRLRAQEKECGLRFSQQLPAIALTASSHAEHRLQALAAGFQMHIAKPIELAELALMIATLTQARQ